MQVTATQVRPFSWGFAEYLYMSSDVTVKNLHFKKGGYTSYHYHRRRMELLHVVSGIFKIYTLDQMKENVRESVVVPGNKIAIYPGEAHQIVAEEDGILTETSEEYSEYDTVRIIKNSIVNTLPVDSLKGTNKGQPFFPGKE